MKFDTQLHLRGFANSFINKDYVGRWEHILLEKPSKAKTELVKFERQLNTKYCILVEKLDIDSMGNITESTQGVYFDGFSEPRVTTIDEAFESASSNCRDVLFSIKAGELAVFMFHEGWAWLCKK